jgi:putative ABC transport system permease protein
MWLKLAWKSLLNRKVTTILTFCALLVSVSLLFAIEHIRVQTKDNFKRTVSGIDLVVAARSSQINVLLSSVFRIGANPNAISWKTYEDIRNNDKVTWTIPFSLGDSFKGFPVVGTSSEYFKNYHYGSKQTLAMSTGRPFARANEAVLGASVARHLKLRVGQSIVISHGSGNVSFSHHDDHPVLIAGILVATGTPVDKSVHVPLIAIEEMHKTAAPSLSRSSFAKPANVVESDHDDHEHDNDAVQAQHTIPNIASGSVDLIGQPSKISAFMLKAESPFAILTLQRDINQYQNEAVSAIMPQVALSELWQILGSVESVLQLIALLVLFASLIGLVTMLLASMHERRSEIAVLRAVGASPWFIGSLIQTEALLISVFALIGAYGLVSVSILVAGNYLLNEFGLYVSPNILSGGVLLYAGSILLLTLIVACIPAFTAYRNAKYLFR